MFWKGVVGYLPVNIAQGVVGMLSIVVFTRLLTPEAYGVYALAFAAMSLAHTALFNWLESAMARFQAREAGTEGAADHYATLYRAVLLLGGGVLAAGAAAIWLAPLAGPMKIALAAGLFAIPLRSAVKLALERRRADGEVGSAAALDIGQTVGAFGFGALLAWLGLGGASPLLGFAITAALCVLWALPKELKLAPGGRPRSARAREYAAYGAPVALSMILALALATTDRFIIAAYLGEAAVGVYHAGYSLSNRTLDVLFIWLGMAGGPAVVAALERGGRAAFAAQARDQIALMAALCVPAAVGLALVARPLADVMVGEGLREGAAMVTPWIAASGLFAGLTIYYFNQAFTLARRTQLLFASMAIPAVANVALCLILIPRFGLPGAMWATTASYGLGLVSSAWLGRLALSMPSPWLDLGKIVVACVAMAAAVVALPAWGGIAELATKACVGLFIYALAAMLLDIAGLRDFVLRRLRPTQARPA